MIKSTNSTTGTVTKQNDTFVSGVYGQNGVKITVQKVNTTGTTYKDYCPKCGQLKSLHTGLFGNVCPKSK